MLLLTCNNDCNVKICPIPSILQQIKIQLTKVLLIQNSHFKSQKKMKQRSHRRVCNDHCRSRFPPTQLDHHRLFDFSGLTHEQASDWPAEPAKLVGRPPTSPANRLLARHTEQSAQHHPAARTSPTASTALGKWKSSSACSKKTFQLSWALQYLEQENFRLSSLVLRCS